VPAGESDAISGRSTRKGRSAGSAHRARLTPETEPTCGSSLIPGAHRSFSVNAVSASESEKRRIELGPLFSLGVVVLAYGLLRRRRLAFVVGLGAIWLDQRSEFGRSLTKRARAKYLTVQFVGD
jgi:hypothetical protein